MTLKLLKTVQAWATLAALTVFITPIASAQDYVRLLGNAYDKCAHTSPLPETYVPEDSTYPAALHNESGNLRVTTVAPGWHSAQWLRTPASDEPGNNGYIFTNRWTGEILTAYLGEDHKPVVAALKPDAMIPNFQQRDQPRRKPGAAEQVWQVTPLADNAVSLSQPGIRVGRSGQTWLLAIVPETCLPDIQIGGDIPEARSKWRVEVSEAAAPPPPEGGYVWLQKSGTMKAINVETGTPTASEVQPGWLSAQWEMKSLASIAPRLGNLPAGAPVMFINRWTGQAFALQGKGADMRAVVVPPPTFNGQDKLTSMAGVWIVSSNPAADGSVDIIAATGPKLGVKSDGANLGGSNYGWTIASHHPGYVPPAPVESYVRLISTDGRAINNQSGAAQAGAFEPGWWSAMWVVQPMPANGAEVVGYRNRWTNQYLGVVDGKLAMVDGTASVPDPSQVTYAWQVVGGSPDASKKSLRNLKSGKYLGTAPSGASLYDGAPRYVWNVTDVQ